MDDYNVAWVVRLSVIRTVDQLKAASCFVLPSSTCFVRNRQPDTCACILVISSVIGASCFHLPSSSGPPPPNRLHFARLLQRTPHESVNPLLIDQYQVQSPVNQGMHRSSEDQPASGFCPPRMRVGCMGSFSDYSPSQAPYLPETAGVGRSGGGAGGGGPIDQYWQSAISPWCRS